jgi:HEAT repeat protein/Na+/melibiose symporter-like transporter
MKELTPLKRARSLNRLLLNAFFGAAYGPIIGVGGAVFTGYALWMGLAASDIALMTSVALLAGLIFPFSATILAAVRKKKQFLIFAGFTETFFLVSISFVPLLARGSTGRLVLLACFVLASTLTANALGPMFSSWVSTIIPEDGRARFMSRQSVIGTVTGMAISFIVGRYIDRMGGSNYASFVFPFGFALFVGWGRYWVFQKVPFPQALEHDERKVTLLKSLLMPLEHRPFRRLLFFNLTVVIGGSIGDPFYSVYMLQKLKVSYSFIALLTIIGSLVAILTWLAWGRISQKLGNKPVLWVSVLCRFVMPLLWLFATPRSYVSVLILINVLSAVMGPGFGIAITTIQYELVPAGPEKSAYFASWAFIHSIVGVIMTVTGALLARGLSSLSFSVAGIAFDNLKVIFVISGLLLLVPFFLLTRVPDVRIRGRAIALRQVFRGNPIAFAFNAMLLSLQRDTSVRARAIEGMGRSRSPMAMEALVRSLADPNPRIRQAAVKALGGTRSEEAVSLLAGELANEESPIRIEAAESLGRLKDPAAIPPLQAAMDSPDAHLASTAARALAEIGGERNAQALFERLQRTPASNKILFLALVEALSTLRDARVIQLAFDSLPSFSSTIIRLQILNAVCRATGADNEFYALLGQERLRLAQRLFRIQKSLRRSLPTLVPLRKLLAVDAIDELALAIEEEDYARIPELALFLADTVEWKKPQAHPGLTALRCYLAAQQKGVSERPEVFSFVCLERLFQDEFRTAALRPVKTR